MANMFRCVLAGGGGGNGADLIVTCDSVFSGTTITCTDGTSTFTETCPSTSPYTVTFESIPTGTWTISGTYDGQTFSTNATITDFEALLGAIPEGSTATPTDNIQTWLHCANIWDKSYTTASEVLADASTLQALIASNNASDYMARSTTWSTDVTADSSAMGYIGLNDYCSDALLADSTWLTAICNSAYFESVLNVKAPTMTSDTQPSGLAFASSEGSYPAYLAFDGVTTDLSKTWLSANTVVPHFVGYKFESSVKVNKFRFYAPDGKSLPTAFTIQGSNDGTSYEDIISLTNDKINQYVDYVIPNNVRYQYYRMYITAMDRGSSSLQYAVRVNEMQFYGRT